MTAPDGRSPEGRRVSPALGAVMVHVSRDVAKLAARLFADAMTLTRIADALARGDRDAFGRMKRYVFNGQGGADAIGEALAMLESEGAGTDPEFMHKRKQQQRWQQRDKEKWKAWHERCGSLGRKVHDQMIEAEFPGMAWAAGEERWQAKYGGLNAEHLLAAYVVQRSANLAELQRQVSGKVDELIREFRGRRADDPADGNVVPFDRGKLH